MTGLQAGCPCAGQRSDKRTETAVRRCCRMDSAIRLAPLLLIAVAIDPAAAEPPRPTLKLQSIESVRLSEPRAPQQDAAFRHRLFQEDEETRPAWTLPFGLQSDDSDRRVTFSVRPGRGLKAKARIRF